jgi:succinate dehydrogenase / fumarate reductase cytochrome b subunit
MTASAKPIVRPLSPHVMIYRLPLAAILSITHRITGIGLSLGLVLLTWWVASAAYGPGAYAMAMSVIGSWVGLLILFGFSVALFFHLCNGIRHLVWDTGRSYEISETKRGNILVLFGTIVLTLVTWFVALM